MSLLRGSTHQQLGFLLKPCGVGATRRAGGCSVGFGVHRPRGCSALPVFAGTVQSSPVTVSPSGSPGGSQYDSDSDMAFSVNRSSSASESSLGKGSPALGSLCAESGGATRFSRARLRGRCYISCKADRNNGKETQSGGKLFTA